MSVRPSTVLIGWLLANLVLAVMLVAFGENAFAFVLYFASALPVTAFAVLLWRFWGDPAVQPDRLLMPRSTGAVLLLAIAITAVGLGLIFGIWLWLPGALASVAAVLALVRRRGVRPGAQQL